MLNRHFYQLVLLPRKLSKLVAVQGPGGLPKLGAELDEWLQLVLVFPNQLIGQPRGHGRLGQSVDAGGQVSLPSLHCRLFIVDTCCCEFLNGQPYSLSATSSKSGADDEPLTASILKGHTGDRARLTTDRARSLAICREAAPPQLSLSRDKTPEPYGRPPPEAPR